MSSPSLQSFNPHAVHYFTSASSSPSSPSNHPSSQIGIPGAVYPAHILAASASPKQSDSSTSTSSTQPAPVPPHARLPPIPMQSPQPRPVQTKGFAVAVGRAGPAAKGAPIFEPFHAKRPITPELDAVLKKKSGQWGQWELEESLRK
ncbi:hypothetical protein FRC19_008831 [Serendipita sp. 401]|nr:hypothetical protein FRC15_009635 [Serendipita sp. 397]KAG8826477.1 hypothetical protein FRC19_008831 [Serendipita sp. 401]KAG9057323.1 hypothetical protein FS842_007462 [Serendipita sp. 407]